MIMGKRGQPMRQHSMSRTRFIKSRTSVHTTPVETKTPVEEATPISYSPAIYDPPRPELTCLGNISFELLLCLYLHTALFCQYIYLYKTVWWYPISLPPSNTSLNFHQIDRNLTLFLSVFTFRRLLWAVLWNCFRPRTNNAPGIMAWLMICLLSGVIWAALLVAPVIHLFSTTAFLNMVVLCYPILLWLPLTGLCGNSCLNSIVTWMSIVDAGKISCGDSPDGVLSSRHHLIHNIGLARLVQRSGLNNRGTGDTAAAKQQDLEAMNNEIKILCQDFNSRVSDLLFCSMVCAYYVGLVPMFFMKSYQYYDMMWSLQHTALIFLNSFGLLSSHLFNPNYIHVLHRCALIHAEFKNKLKQTIAGRISENSKSTENSRQSTNDHPESSVTDEKLMQEILKNDSCHKRFFYVFSDPLRLTDWLLICHAVIVAFQIYLLVTSSKWDHLISIALMQFFSYYVLFRSTRDRIVLNKVRQLQP